MCERIALSFDRRVEKKERIEVRKGKQKNQDLIGFYKCLPQIRVSVSLYEYISLFLHINVQFKQNIAIYKIEKD